MRTSPLALPRGVARNAQASVAVARPAAVPVAAAPTIPQAPLAEATAWFTVLMAAICFEGLGRKFVPAIPPVALYFAKDLVLVGMIMRFGIQRATWNAAFRLYREFLPVLVVAFVVTALQMFNPEHASPLLGLIGLRAYWFWFVAPLVLPSVFTSSKHLKNAAIVTGAFSLLIALVATYQFSLPPEAPLNSYAWGDPDANIAVVATTNRVRVTSTFSFVSGFANYVVLGALLLFVLASECTGYIKWACVAVGCVLAFSGVASASRSVIAWFVVLVPLYLGKKVFAPRIALIFTGTVVVGLAGLSYWLPDALQGLWDRFADTEEGQTRLAYASAAFPPIALLLFDYPLLGIGTGMMLSARLAFGVIDAFPAEVEPQRMLIELGLVGYLIVWLTRLGIVVALLRVARVLRAQGAPTPARFALALVPVCIISQIVMDHVAQALFFLSVGIVLAMAIQRSSQSRRAKPSAEAADRSRGRLVPRVRSPARPQVKAPTWSG